MAEVLSPGTSSYGEAADIILKALEESGVVVMNPQDVEWGTCPDNFDEDGGPHHVSLDLCAFCLEYSPD
jgi:hypothetical protein